MYEQVEKPKKNESNVMDRDVVSKDQICYQPTMFFSDNRPEALRQRMLQDNMQSTGFGQLKSNHTMSENGLRSEQSKTIETSQNGHMSNQRTIIQKKPIAYRGPIGTHEDSEYKGVKMLALGEPHKKAYKIVSEGALKGAYVYHDGMDYYTYNTETQEADWENILSIQIHVAENAEAMEEITDLRVGAPGTGCRAGKKDILLHLDGMNQCMGWVLYNKNAAYMEHIFMKAKKLTLVDIGAVQTQIGAVVRLFCEQTGTEPTNLDLAYVPYFHQVPGDKELLKTIFATAGIVPNLIPSKSGTFQHTVGAGEDSAQIWNCEAINVPFNKTEDSLPSPRSADSERARVRPETAKRLVYQEGDYALFAIFNMRSDEATLTLERKNKPVYSGIAEKIKDERNIFNTGKLLFSAYKWKYKEEKSEK